MRRVKIKFIAERYRIAEMVAMVTKALKRKEVELGFVHIPAKNREELMGDMPVPFDTKYGVT